MEKIVNTIHGLKPAMMMAVVQVALAGVNVFYKLASSIGMSISVLIAYRFVFAAACIVPLALLLERKYGNLFSFVLLLLGCIIS
ncbi:hypothetical protein ACSBR1_019222 [Camellia fascicularis]